MAKKSEKDLDGLPTCNLQDVLGTVEQHSSSALVSNVVIAEVTPATCLNIAEIQRNETKSSQKIDSSYTDKVKVDDNVLNDALLSPISCLETTNLAQLLTNEVTGNTEEREIFSQSPEEANYVKENLLPLSDSPQECELLNTEISDVDENINRNEIILQRHPSDSIEKQLEGNFEKVECKLSKIIFGVQEQSDSHPFHTSASAYNTGKDKNPNFLSEGSKLKESAEKEVTSSEEVTSETGHLDQASNERNTVSKRSRQSLDGNSTGESLTQREDGSRELDSYSGLQWLPDQLLDAVLQWLPFADVSRVGGTCRRLRRAAAATLRREMRSLVARVETAMTALEAETTAQAQGGACMVPVVMRVILHTVLRVLLGEARVLRAVCWRYMRMDELNSPSDGTCLRGEQSGRLPFGPAPVVCFPGGDLFDEFERLLAMVCVDNFSNDIDPEVVTGLFMRMEKFLDYFEGSVEPLLRCGETPFGVKVADLLGACETADCAVSVTHGASNRPFLVTVNFELRDASAVDSPPPFDGQMPSRMRLRLLARYLRNNVRWVNFFRPMRELWDLQDEIENRWTPSATGEHRDISRHHPLHLVVMDAVKAKAFRRNLGMPPPRPSPSHLPRKQARQREMYEQVVLRAHPPLWRETFSRRINPAVRSLRLGLSCNLELSGCDKSMLPLDLEFLDEERIDSATRHPGLSPQASHVRPPATAGAAPTGNTDADPIVTDVSAAGPSTAEDPVAESMDTSGQDTANEEGLLPIIASSEAGAEGAVAVEQPPRPPLPQPQPQRLPPPMAHGEIPLDWGPWLRLRRNYRSPATQDGVPTDGWDDYGSSLRCGGEYGFRGEVRVTFPPRALSSIVTETVIQVTDTMVETNITSDRRFPPYIPSMRHICVFRL